MKLTASDLAFGEATHNLHSAERFFDVGAVDKAYCAAYIASVWLSLGTALELKSTRDAFYAGGTPLSPLVDYGNTTATEQGKPSVGEHQHSHECGHRWECSPLDNNEFRCAYRCKTTYHEPTAQWPCPEKCPMWKKTTDEEQSSAPGQHKHGHKCRHHWPHAREIDPAPACTSGCGTVYNQVTKDLPCPRACLAAM